MGIREGSMGIQGYLSFVLLLELVVVDGCLVIFFFL